MHALEIIIEEKKAKVAVIGLGYVGINILSAVAKAGFPSVGYDVNHQKIDHLKKREEVIHGVDFHTLFSKQLQRPPLFTAKEEDLQNIDIFIIAVPTSLDDHQSPDLSCLAAASHLIYHHLKKDSLVIVQSTSFPGTTEDFVLPILNQGNFKAGIDYLLSFIPEISDFGNDHFDFFSIPKIVAAVDAQSANIAKLFYKHLTKDVFLAPSIKVAEGAKMLQNAYRLINISFINEMKIMFDKMGIDIWQVIEAAKTKPFGFTPFSPGPGIGGDCIPVDPYYLIWKAKESDAPVSMLELAGNINQKMNDYLISKIIHAVGVHHRALQDCKVLILGVTFKKEVSDTRESPGIKLIYHLRKMGVDVSYHDPYVPKIYPTSRYPHLSMEAIAWECVDLQAFDCVVIITDHSFYNFIDIAKKSRCIVDTRNTLKNTHGFEEKIFKA